MNRISHNFYVTVNEPPVYSEYCENKNIDVFNVTLQVAGRLEYGIHIVIASLIALSRKVKAYVNRFKVVNRTCRFRCGLLHAVGKMRL